MDVGGAQQQLLTLLSSIDRTRFDLRVILLDRTGELADQLKSAEVVHVSLGRQKPLDPFAFFKLCTEIRRFRPHILHSWLFIANLYGRLVGRFSGVPVLIASERGMDLNTVYWGWASRNIKRAAMVLLAPLSDLILVNSEALRQHLSGVGIPQRKMRVIYNAFDSDKLNRRQVCDGKVREALDIAADSPLVGIVARLDRDKNLETFLRMAAILTPEFNGLHFLVVGGGDGRYLSELKGLAGELGIRERVVFTGHLDDVFSMVSAIDVFVLCSISESFPNTIMEAMASGKPVVSTSVGGVPELVTEGVTGFLIPPRRPDLLANRVAMLLSSSDLRTQLGLSGKDRVANFFSQADIIPQFEDVYTKLVDRSRCVRTIG